MIESKLKVKNCNRGQLLRPCWVSSARCNKLYEVFSWSTDIHILTKCRWWWPQMKLKSKFLPIGMASVTCETRDKGQYEKSRISCCRYKDTDTGQTQTVPRSKRLADRKGQCDEQPQAKRVCPRKLDVRDCIENFRLGFWIVLVWLP